MPGESHLVGRAKGNRPGCLHGPSSKKLLSLFGIPVAHVFVIDNAAFSSGNMSESVLHRPHV